MVPNFSIEYKNLWVRCSKENNIWNSEILDPERNPISVLLVDSKTSLAKALNEAYQQIDWFLNESEFCIEFPDSNF
ncbi:hypothetical protein QUB11_27985 [Microcoleus sp. B6-A1]|uniref:hypothetical protein n=1 Tax=Microcoleus sp. B6-A1 TaxID=2818684 RepID=UPI002FD127CF